MGNFTSGHQAAHRRLSFLDLLGSQISGSLIPLSRWNHVGNLSLSAPHTRHGIPAGGAGTNTTIAVVATNARCTKAECFLLAQSANHGLARAIHPSHTRHDGDLAFVCATGTVDAHLDRLRVMVTEVTAAAVRDAVAYHRATP